ncbi:hypothetical protein DID77_02960 [Candidatus Marinamargulisbacteria bacterium SCGC AG-439-L15]|nr:hypothetical protein DID77_02960 [Candidatus Marinamargulisbacteria bacterium SCGC AG-439-L15]
MNIAIFTDTYFPQINGVVISTDTFKKSFEEMGHTVYIMCPKIKGYKDESDAVWRFPSVPYPFQREYRLVMPYSKKLKKFSELNIDVIHAQTPFSMGYLAGYLGKKYKIPVVHTYHTFFMEYVHYVPLLPKKWMKKWATGESRRFCNRCKAIVVPSSEMKSPLLEYGVTVPIDVIPTGVTPPVVSEQDKNTFLKESGISASDNLLVFAGRLGLEKNIYFLFEAFAQILKRVPQSKLLIIGDGPERENLESKIKKHGLSSAVVFTGYLSREDVFTALSASKCLLFPSKTETQGLTVVESLSVGTPVVCINEMGVRDVLENEKGGFLTEDSIDDYVEKTVLLLENESIYQEKKKAALERAKEFSELKSAKKMISIFERVCQ